MQLADPQVQSAIVFLALAIGFSLARAPRPADLLSHITTTELKGFAILVVISAHIGYLLFPESDFLFPLSALAGVAVDLFLVLSGFGLSMSALRESRTPLAFYRQHAAKLYIPLWAALALLFAADALILGRTYDLAYLAQSFAGFFPSADAWADVNSPLWYFTFILFFYVAFPFVSIRRAPWLGALVMAGAAYGAAWLAAPYLPGVAHLYELHLYAFPLGMLIAWFVHAYGGRLRPRLASFPVRFILLAILGGAIAYFAIHSAVGTPFEEYGSLGTLLLVLAFFQLAASYSPLLSLLGAYSYEIYLLHWPLLARFDLVYGVLPASLATLLYLAIFLALGYAMRRLVAPALR